MYVLNCPVTPDLLDRWRAWLAPDRQPVYLSGADAERLDLRAVGAEIVPRAQANLGPQEADTCTTWAVAPEADHVARLTGPQWDALPGRTRRELLRLQVQAGRGGVPLGRRYADLLPGMGAGRFLWRRAHLRNAVLQRVVTDLAGGQRAACQRASVTDAVWSGASPALPRVRDLAGTFALGGVGNCFGAVMGAAGVSGAEEEWMQREPFEAFLRERTGPGGHDERPGTVLVWRGQRGVEHAAVTLGGGWAFQKAAQTWWTPRVVLPTRALIMGTRTPGWRLERWHLT